jgi:hypothetical protein
MRPAEAKLVGRQRIKLRQAVYRVEVFATDDGFHGEWVCACCNQRGEATIGLANAPAAAEWAKTGLAIHHAISHDDGDENSE